MDQKDCVAALKTCWNHYIMANPEGHEEKWQKLDIFLNRFIYYHKKHNFKAWPDFSDNTTVGNILSRQFLYDIHTLCSECTANNEDTAPLIHYLLEGRGWKILWLIKHIGVQTLSCNKELANLLLSFFPLCTQFPLWKRKKGDEEHLLSDDILDDVESCFQPYIRRCRPKPNRSVNGSEVVKRKKFSRKLVHSKVPNVGFHITKLETSDTDFPIESHTTKKKTLVRFKLSPFDFSYYTIPGQVSSEPSSGEEDVGDDKLEAAVQEPLTSSDFCANVISLLRNICQGDDTYKNSIGVPVSANILPFAVNSLVSMHHKKSYVQNWSSRDVHRAKEQLVRLVFTSAASLVDVPDGLFFLEQCSVMSCMLSIAEDTLSPKYCDGETLKPDEATPVEILSLGFSIVYGCLRLLCLVCEHNLCRQNFSGFLPVISLTTNQQMVCALCITKYEHSVPDEQKQSCRMEVNNLIRFLSKMLIISKGTRVTYWHHRECTKRRHRRCAIEQYSHHHHDMLGVSNSNTALSQTPSCCVSSLLSILLRIYKTSRDSGTQMLILVSLKKVGLCCCIRMDIALESILSCLPQQKPFLRQAALNFIETTVLEQLSGSPTAYLTMNVCSVCRNNHDSTLTLVEQLETLLADEGTVSSEVLHNLIGIHESGWGAVVLYCRLLVHEDTVLVHQLEKHILQLCSSGNFVVKAELFLRVVISIFEQTFLHQLPVEHLMATCIGSLCILLKEDRLSALFLDTGRLKYLTECLLVPTVRPLALKALLILIVAEVRRSSTSRMGQQNDFCDRVDIKDIANLTTVKIFDQILLNQATDCSAFMEHMQSLTDSNYSADWSEITSKLEHETDLWTTCSILVHRCKEYKLYFQQCLPINLAYKSCTNLLKSLGTSEALQCNSLRQPKKSLKCALRVLEALLSVCLAACPFTVKESGLIVDRSWLTAEISNYIGSFVQWPAEDLQLLLESFLRSATAQPVHTWLKSEQAHLEVLMPFCDDGDDTIESNDELAAVETTRNQFDDGYEADIELPDGFRDCELGENLNVVTPELYLRYPGMSQVVLTILVQMADHVIKLRGQAWTAPSSIRSVTSIVNRLSTLCRDNKDNCQLLYGQGTLQVILKDYHYFLIHDDDELKDLQSSLLNLFVLIAQQSITSLELKLFIDLFKADHPPWVMYDLSKVKAVTKENIITLLHIYFDDATLWLCAGVSSLLLDCLLSALNRLIRRIPLQPSSVLCFPSCQSGDALDLRITAAHPVQKLLPADYDLGDESEDSPNIPSVLLPALIHGQHKQKAIFSAWAAATAVLPVLSSGFTLSNSFSISLWLKILASNAPVPKQKIIRTGSRLSPGNAYGLDESWQDSSADVLELSGVTTQGQSNNGISKVALHLISVGANASLLEIWLIAHTEDLLIRMTNASSQTYHVFSGVVCKRLLRPNMWHHVAVNYSTSPGNKILVCQIQLFINGHTCSPVQLKFDNSLSKEEHVSFLLLGHEFDNSTKVNPMISWQLGNLLLFRDNVLTQDTSIKMSVLGPDWCNLPSGTLDENDLMFPPRLMAALVKTGLDPTLMQNALQTSFHSLETSLVMMFSAKYPKIAVQFDEFDSIHLQKDRIAAVLSKGLSTKASSVVSSGPSVLPLRLFHDMTLYSCCGLDATLKHQGGVTVLLLLLARTVECCTSEEGQAKAASLMLSYANSCSQNRAAFMAASGPALLVKLLSSSRMATKYLLLKELVDACLSTSVIECHSGGLRPVVIRNTSAVVVDPQLFCSVLTAWKVWEKDDVNVGKTLFLIVKILVQDDHPYCKYNRRALAAHHFLDNLLDACKDRFINDEQRWIPAETCHLLIFIMRVMIGEPPNVEILSSICEFIILVHPLANTCVCHARNMFYFNLRSTSRSVPVAVSRPSTASSVPKLESNSGAATAHKAQGEHGVCDNQETHPTLPVDACKLSKALTNLQIKQNQEEAAKIANLAEESSTAKTDLPINKETERNPNNDMDGEQNINASGAESMTEGIAAECTKKERSGNATHHEGEKADECKDETENSQKDSSNTFNEDNFIGLQQDSSDKEKAADIGNIRGSDQGMVCTPTQCETKHTTPECISGPEDSFVSEEWEVFTMMESEESGSDAVDVDEQDTIPLLCADMLLLLEDTVNRLPDKMLSSVLGPLIHPATLIVLAYHPNSRVRTAVIKLIAIYLLKSTDEQRNSFLKMKGFYLLSNQLFQYTPSPDLVDACISVLLNKPFTMELTVNLSTVDHLSPVQQASISLLMSVIPNSIHSSVLCHNIFGILQKICETVPLFLSHLLEKAVLETMMKTLENLIHSPLRLTDIVNQPEQDLLFDDIKRFLDFVSISSISVKNGVYFHTFNDLLTLLSYVEKKETDHVGNAELQKVRSLQCSCLQSALEALYQNSAVLKKDVAPKKSESKETTATTLSERLRQVFIKSVDFIVHSDPVTVASDYEQSFIRFLTQFMVHAITTVLKKRRGRSGFWPSLLWGIKDTLRLQLTRLMVHQLSPIQSQEARLFVISVIMKEERPDDLISMVLHSSSALEQKFSIYLHELMYGQSLLLASQDLDACCELTKVLEACGINVLPPPVQPSDEWTVTAEAKKMCPEEARKKKALWLKQVEPIENRLLSKYDNLLQSISDCALSVTRSAMDAQNLARRAYLESVKTKHSQKLNGRRSWQQLITQLTHERAIWHFPKNYPTSWQLDFTEGVNRERRRLIRCHLGLEERYLLPDHQIKLDALSNPQPFAFLHENEDLSLDTAALVDRLHANDKIRYTCQCTIISPCNEIPGEVLVGTTCMYFVGEEGTVRPLECQGSEKDIIAFTWLFEEVKEVLTRRYELQDNAIELFLMNGRTFLIAFSTSKDRDQLVFHLRESNLPNLVEANEMDSLTQTWREGSLTNFAYLMQLNKLGGRSFNDLMQYPVFPFVLSRYDRDSINLLDTLSYRNLSKPMSVQDQKQEQHFVNMYNFLKNSQKDGSFDQDMMPAIGPYHYGSHYSNSGIVLHFLVRLPPFTRIFLNFQGNSFDIPDRSFHSLQTSWRLSSSESRTDMKELIPEFYFLPEFLTNREGFAFGERQTGEQVNDVTLPSWCRSDSRLFVLIHRQALESDFVREHIHHWIDLVFGYQQTGKAAVNAINVFHPATYFGFDLNSIEDELQCEAVKTMVKTFGQTPKQLFLSPHPTTALQLTLEKKKSSRIRPVLPDVEGLKWGSYVGSPAGDEPTVVWHHDHNPPIASFVCLLTADVFGLSSNCCVLLSYSKEKGASLVNITYVNAVALVTWGHADSNVRVKLRRDQSPTLLLKGDMADPVCFCASVPDCNRLFVGQESGITVVYNVQVDSTNNHVSTKEKTVYLYGHNGPITSIHICSIFHIVATASVDGSCILWDLESLSYIRCIASLGTPVKQVTVSNTSADVGLISDQGDTSKLLLFTINGHKVGEVSTKLRMCSICFSWAHEGVSVNVVATGMANGTVRLWSTWDLSEVSVIRADKFDKPITCLTYSADSQHLYAANSEGVLVIWENTSKEVKPPKYHTLV